MEDKELSDNLLEEKRRKKKIDFVEDIVFFEDIIK